MRTTGHYFLRVSSSNWKRADGKNVRTVRDVIAEVDQNGNVVDEWRLAEILDPYRQRNEGLGSGRCLSQY